METAIKVIQVLIAVGILNVWLMRSRMPTSWRGGNAQNLKEEFAAYGLPGWLMNLVGFFKLLFALLLLLGTFLPGLTRPAAIGMAILMLGAVAMHFKIGDPVQKSLPALSLLILSLVVAAY